ncbi:MAG: hypothetical protein CVU41_10660 [Chloroflexi bacterium HGW-Chloroflexi-3]|nr:MAG: hypothetical protein CVU41_10660 [Chloroflexi bacterium HGW-Chloroflexi-3]
MVRNTKWVGFYTVELLDSLVLVWSGSLLSRHSYGGALVRVHSYGRVQNPPVPILVTNPNFLFQLLIKLETRQNMVIQVPILFAAGMQDDDGI